MSKKIKSRKVPKKEITENDLKNTYFVPMKRMHEAIEIIEEPRPPTSYIRCDYNLLNLKHERSTRECYDELAERFSSARHCALFYSACYKAIYSHDWDRLLYILKRIPRWRFTLNGYTLMFYLRVLTILLMYHPESQTKGFFNEYLHMVWGCRLDQDKKAILKTILTLSKRMYRTVHSKQRCWEDQKQRKAALAALAQNNDDN